MLVRTSIAQINDKHVSEYISTRKHKPHLFTGEVKIVMAKVKMWLFYDANKYLLHDDITYYREEVIERILEGCPLEEAFYMEIN